MNIGYLAILVFSFASCCVYVEAASNVVFCYYDSTAAHRPGAGRVSPDDLDPNLCTHMTYAFFGFTPMGKVTYYNYTNDINEGNVQKFLNLKTKNPNVKLLASIGGRAAKSSLFSYVMKTALFRENLISNLTEFCISNGFEGVNIQWEYPGMDGGSTADKQNFVTFLKSFKEANTGLMIVVTVGAKASMMTLSYDIPQISMYVDLISLETCHYHAVTADVTGQNAPLYLSSVDTDPSLSVNATVINWITNGAPRNKLALGIASFGLSFSLANSAQTSVGSPSNGAGVAGPFLQTPGRMTYFEICRRFINLPTWTLLFDQQQQNPYAYKNYQWIGYDNPYSVGIKTEYAKQENLAGISFWALDYDDIPNYCGGGKFPMLSAAYHTIFP